MACINNCKTDISLLIIACISTFLQILSIGLDKYLNGFVWNIILCFINASIAAIESVQIIMNSRDKDKDKDNEKEVA